MAHILYRAHTIVSSACFDEASGQWKLNAFVSWQGSGTNRIQFANNSPEIFFRFEDAEKAGVEYSKNWVDNKLTEIDSQSSASQQSKSTKSFQDRTDSENLTALNREDMFNLWDSFLKWNYAIIP